MTCEYSGCNAPEGECMGECLRNPSIAGLQERIVELEKEVNSLKLQLSMAHIKPTRYPAYAVGKWQAPSDLVQFDTWFGRIEDD